MSDPISSGASKVAQEMMNELQSAMQQQEQIAETQETQQAHQVQPTSEIQFEDALGHKRVGASAEAKGALGAHDVLRAARGAQVGPSIPAIGQALDTKPAHNGLHRVMVDVVTGQDQLEGIMKLALSGRKFSSSELLALQAGVYRFTQELELTSKVVEKTTSAVKQTMNTQV